MKTTKTDSLISQAALFGKSAFLATVAVAASVTSAGAITIDFDQDSNGNALDAGTVIDIDDSNKQHLKVNPWSGVQIEKVGGNGKGVTLFNSSCNPFKIENSTSNKNDYSSYDPLNSGISDGCNRKIGGSTFGDEDLATGGNLNTVARNNILIVQENNKTNNQGLFRAPDDQGDGGKIKFTFDRDVALGNIEFLDFDKTDANKINLIAKDADNTIIADYTFSRQTREVIDNITGNVFNNAVNETNIDEAFTGDKLTGNPYVEYFLANQSVVPHEFENSVWDFYFGQELGQIRSLEVQFNGISGAISELSYEEMYSDFLSEPKVRVPEPGSIAALAFIGGGMFLSRRRQSH
ncbi:MAG: PEP-CTERM sorting domain-containing protein [Okeania sp. SIO2C9]|uniref:PEP-CTERM sorting domain-containing protein n=1 Tax=Okeania sp. SIO2C9 TaxID=2607791 RepID=UPI0013BF5C2F|nr:PEP-CTERM sorting domain-containing protein [Okeania sp. SIO2C9]NEQ77657.1 PEP-CTERM sorting domain-containing protein [Okeania sp. SIO2C9]